MSSIGYRGFPQAYLDTKRGSLSPELPLLKGQKVGNVFPTLIQEDSSLGCNNLEI